MIIQLDDVFFCSDCSFATPAVCRETLLLQGPGCLSMVSSAAFLNLYLLSQFLRDTLIGAIDIWLIPATLPPVQKKTYFIIKRAFFTAWKRRPPIVLVLFILLILVVYEIETCFCDLQASFLSNLAGMRQTFPVF